MKCGWLFFLLSFAAAAETRTMTLRQALDLALSQNPDVMMARLDQQKAGYQVTIARDPFRPKLYAGSGAAWTYGYPSSIDGNAPSIVQAKTQMALFNRPQSYQVAQANQGIHTAEIDVARQQDEVAYRVASLFLDAEQAVRSMEAAQRQAEDLGRVRDLTEARVSEGRELPIESKKASVAVLKARQNAETLAINLSDAESSLALVLGLGADDRVQPSTEERTPLAVPPSEEATIEEALNNSNELKRLESNVQSKMLEIKGYRAERLPKVDLVAQYSLFAKYTYVGFFQKFQRNNAQLGASVEIPLIVGRASQAYIFQAESDIAKLRLEATRTRTRIASDLRRAFQDVRRAEGGRDVARADLDLAREQLGVDLSLMDEGRVPLAKVEEDRATENSKWLAFYDAQHAAEVARLNLLRQTGTLQAALR
jgi:outer membrane protein TolC